MRCPNAMHGIRSLFYVHVYQPKGLNDDEDDNDNDDDDFRLLTQGSKLKKSSGHLLATNRRIIVTICKFLVASL